MKAFTYYATSFFELVRVLVDANREARAMILARGCVKVTVEPADPAHAPRGIPRKVTPPKREAVIARTAM